MPFRDRWNRIVRKSISSSSSGGTADSSTAAKPTPATPSAAAAAADSNPLSLHTTTTSEPGAPLSKAPTSRLAKTLTWRSTNKSTAAGEAPAKKSKLPRKPGKPPHPSERPLTETNLRHQELLGAFAMNFGRRRQSQGGRTSFASNVSPLGSRQPSLDGRPAGSPGPHAAHLHGHSHLGPDMRVSSRAREGIPADVEEEGSQTSS